MPGTQQQSLYVRRTWLPTLFSLLMFASTPAQAAPAADLWAFWDAESDSETTTTVDHAAWQTFLDNSLTPAADGVNRVDYANVSDGERRQLQSYIAQLTAIDPRGLNKKEQMAYWINLYNSLTVEVVLRYPKKDSILRMGEKFFAIGPWDDKLISIADQQLSLNDIEHRILRPIWRDHRIHYAVNCASIGCPNLSSSAYTADTLDQQLSAAEQTYINHPRGVGFNNKGKLTLSSIFKWYLEDFADDEQALLTYLAAHYNDPARLRDYKDNIRYDYDWSLNRPD